MLEKKVYRIKGTDRKIEIGKPLGVDVEYYNIFHHFLLILRKELIVSQFILEILESNEIVVETIEKNIPFHNMDYYLQKIGNKIGMSMASTYDMMDKLDAINQAAVLSLLLKEVALELDLNYKDHIKNSSEIFIISTLDGKIHQIEKSNIKTYKHFAAFRTKEDARIACRIVRPLLKEMFNYND